MIQRKQTIFLILALGVVVACMMLPVGRFEPEGMGTGAAMTNLFVVRQPLSWTVSMFVVLLLTCPLTLWAIFAYKNRKFQAKLCTVNIVLLLVWVLLFCISGFVIGIDKMTFHPAFAACLPAVAIILQLMARRGIIADEKLVRSADRIR